jgi:RNA polymerase-binding transcription factor DksA
MAMQAAGEQADVSAGDVAVEEYRALLRAAERTLDGVDRALAALDEGTYGACELCGAAVPGRDLELDPLVTRCAAHRVAGGD